MKSVVVIAVLAVIGYFSYVLLTKKDEPFLPMQQGRWEIVMDNSSLGTKSKVICADDAQLQGFYDIDRHTMATLSCDIEESLLATSRVIESTCQEDGVAVRMKEALVKNSTDNYTLNRSFVSTPTVADLDFSEVVTLKRLGSCQ